MRLALNALAYTTLWKSCRVLNIFQLTSACTNSLELSMMVFAMMSLIPKNVSTTVAIVACLTSTLMPVKNVSAKIPVLKVSSRVKKDADS